MQRLALMDRMMVQYLVVHNLTGWVSDGLVSVQFNVPALPIWTASLVSFPCSTDFSFFGMDTFFLSFSSASPPSALFRGCISMAAAPSCFFTVNTTKKQTAAALVMWIRPRERRGTGRQASTPRCYTSSSTFSADIQDLKPGRDDMTSHDKMGTNWYV